MLRGDIIIMAQEALGRLMEGNKKYLSAEVGAGMFHLQVGCGHARRDNGICAEYCQATSEVAYFYLIIVIDFLPLSAKTECYFIEKS